MVSLIDMDRDVDTLVDEKRGKKKNNIDFVNRLIFDEVKPGNEK